MSTPKYLDLHAIQTVPFSNLNRDDLGSPKTMIFGGAERTRISSQSWKRQIRLHVEQAIDDKIVRTRRVIRGVAERLSGPGGKGWTAEEAEWAGIQVAISAGKTGKGISLKNDTDEQNKKVLTTNVLLLLPECSIDDLSELALEHRDAITAEGKRATKKENMKPKLPTEKVDAIISRRSATINLFGRMLAELPGANVDGAVQMAHAFTTHSTSVEYDFFTAVDDVEQYLGLPGSGHLNTGMYSAGTFYRYANVNITDLVNNLEGDVDLARALVRAFTNGFINTLPSGKQNATAATTVPDLIHAVVRDDRPVSLASAFESPLVGTSGHATASVDRLNSHADTINTLLGGHHILFAGHTAGPNAFHADATTDLSALGRRCNTFEQLIENAVAGAYPGQTA